MRCVCVRVCVYVCVRERERQKGDRHVIGGAQDRSRRNFNTRMRVVILKVKAHSTCVKRMCQKRPSKEQKRPTDTRIPARTCVKRMCQKRPSKEQKRPTDTRIPESQSP